MVAEPNTDSHPIILGEKLKASLREELRGLLREWNFAPPARCREIARQLTLIYQLLKASDGENG